MVFHVLCRGSKSFAYISRYLLSSLLIVSISGCGSAVNGIITGGNSYSIERSHEKTNSELNKYLDRVKAINDAGSAEGKFLWAQANDSNLNKEPIRDPEILRTMYESAFKSGSLDAHFVLLIHDIRSAATNLRRVQSGKSELITEMTLNLDEVEKNFEQRCWFKKPFVIPGHGGICIGGVSVAGRIWPALRDSVDFPNKAKIVESWRAKDLACEQSQKFKAANASC